MKREIDLIRTILLKAENGDYPYGARVSVDGFTSEQCAYHVALLRDEGLVEAKIIKTTGSPYAAANIDRLTSAGHDFCDGIKQNKIWELAKKHIIKPGATVSLSILVEFVRIEVRKLVFPH